MGICFWYYPFFFFNCFSDVLCYFLGEGIFIDSKDNSCYDEFTLEDVVMLTELIPILAIFIGAISVAIVIFAVVIAAKFVFD